MPSIRYYNQTAPFWDWVASMEASAADHPFFNAYNTQAGEARDANQQGPPHQEGPPPNYSHDGPPPPPEPHHPDGPPPPPEPHHPGGSPPHHHRRHEGPLGCGWGRHGHRGGPHRGHGVPHRGRGGNPFGNIPHGGFGGGLGGGFRGFEAPAGPFPFDMNSIAQFLGQQLGLNPDATNAPTTGQDNEKSENPSTSTAGNKDKDFTPPCDVFDTEDAYILHLSLPGAKKEDLGVNWDADKSELGVAGVIYRPGDEEFLKTLAMDERPVGVFERKVRLGSRARPAMVEVDGIAAKMEDGVLIVRVPKVDAEYVDVRKVEIE